MSFLEILQQAGGFIGTAGAGVAGEVYRRFRSAEKAARQAAKIARENRDVVVAVQEQFVSLKGQLEQQYEDFKRGIRLEVEQMKASIVDRLGDVEDDVERLSEPSIRQKMGSGSFEGQTFVTAEELNRRMDRLEQKIDKFNDDLRGDIIRERGQRHALKTEFSSYVTGESKSWADLRHSFGRMETRVESLIEMQRMLHALQTEMHHLKIELHQVRLSSTK